MDGRLAADETSCHVDDSAFDPGLVDLHGRLHTRFRSAFAVARYAELADLPAVMLVRIYRDNPGASGGNYGASS
jgi:hypothetical protein